MIYKGHLNTSCCLKLQQKGYYFLSGSSDKTVRLWSTDKLQSLRIFVGHQSDVTSALFSSCMNHVISGSLDGSVRIWSIETGEQTQVFYHHCNVGVTALALSNNGMYLLSASQDGVLLCWNLLSGVKINQLQLTAANFPRNRDRDCPAPACIRSSDLRQPNPRTGQIKPRPAARLIGRDRKTPRRR